MTRTDWGEGLTYTGPLNAEYYGTKDSDELAEHIECLATGLVENGDPPEIVEYRAGSLEPMLDALEAKVEKYAQIVVEAKEIMERVKGAS